MPVFYLKFKYPGWGNLYHKVSASNERAAVEKFLRGTKGIPDNMVHVWKGKGLPKMIAGGKIGRV